MLTRETTARLDIQQLLDEWVFCRDNGEWDALRALFADQGRMTTNYAAFDADEFVAFVEGMRRERRLSHHMTGPSRIRILGERALAETEGTLRMRTVVHDVEVDVSALVHYIDRLVVEEGRWRLLDRFPVYIKDRIDPVSPDASVHLREEILAQCPPGARHLVYLQLLVGSAPDPLPVTFDTPEATARLTDGLAWLSETAR